MKKILTVVGARPQFIKAAAVSRALKDSTCYREIVVHTGQHYDPNMSQTFFDELDMGFPTHNLEVASGNHGAQTGEILRRLEPIMLKEQPDLVLVYGDTNSTLGGAVCAAKLNIPTAHVEAGLRSFNRTMPEEINRIVADHVSSLLFCPTKSAVKNLEREGILSNVWNTGDVMFDAVLQFSKKSKAKSTILSVLDLQPHGYILATVHRAENTDQKERLSNIISALATIAKSVPVVLPIHPRTLKMLQAFALVDRLGDIRLIDPVGFLDMVALESQAQLIVTDSGGIQKEAYFHRVPCVTLRGETEWVETIEARWNRLVDVASVKEVTETIRSSIPFNGDRLEIDEYGDGTASDKIAKRLDEYLAQT